MTDLIASALRAGRAVSDARFDRVFPEEHRFRSAVHWTPVGVALRACPWLAPAPGCAVLDIGSAVGKLCLVGALTTEARWFGVESDPALVQVASAVAKSLAVEDRITWLEADARTLDWRRFDAFYLFNPFAEILFLEDVEPTERYTRYTQCVEIVQDQLAALPRGARVATFCGFGGDMPAGFELVRRERMHGEHLCFWQRRGTRKQRLQEQAGEQP